jgi:hypothetical protein
MSDVLQAVAHLTHAEGLSDPTEHRLLMHADRPIMDSF